MTMTRTHVHGRRRLLSRLGAGGLATTALIFGKANPAAALCTRACCRLYTCPNTTYANCRSGPDYTWTCSRATNESCYCCESGGLGGNWTGKSAYRCVYC